MKKLSSIERKEKQTSKITNPRQEILQTILAVINSERAGTVYKQMKPAQLGVKLAHVPTKDLWWFHRKCQLSKGSYGRCFFGCLKVTPPRNI